MDEDLENLKRARALLSSLDINLVKIRLDELSFLKAKSTSKTSNELIDKASALTKWSLQEWFHLKDAAVAYIRAELNSYKANHEKLLSAFDESYARVTAALWSETIYGEANEEIEEWETKTAREFIINAGKYRSAASISVSSIGGAFIDMSKSLFHETYRPNYKSFHRESAWEIMVSAIKKIDLLSLIDDLETMNRARPRVRMAG